MRSLPTDPMRQHNRLMSAFCDDLMARDYHMPRTKAVAEISKQINRESGCSNKAPDTNS